MCRRRRKKRCAEGAEGVKCGEAVSPSPLRVGSREALPPPQKFFLDFAYKMTSFGVFWALLFTIHLHT